MGVFRCGKTINVKQIIPCDRELFKQNNISFQVLDDSFEELHVNVAGPNMVPDLELIPIIRKRTPQLSSLNLDFISIDTKSSMAIVPLIQSLNQLSCLTSLTLQHLNKSNSYFRALGIAAPHLKHLGFSDMEVSIENLLDLMFGENRSQMENIEQDILHHYQMPSEWVSPLCRSLECLQLESLEERQRLANTCEFAPISPNIIALVLRHMRKLKTITYSGTSVCNAVKILHQNSIPLHEADSGDSSFRLKAQPEEMSCHTGNVDQQLPILCPKAFSGKKNVLQSIVDGQSPLHTSGTNLTVYWLYLSGTLSLTSLDNVNIRKEEILDAIRTLCPQLERLVVMELTHGKAMSPSELETTLSTMSLKVCRFNQALIAF